MDILKRGGFPPLICLPTGMLVMTPEETLTDAVIQSTSGSGGGPSTVLVPPGTIRKVLT